MAPPEVNKPKFLANCGAFDRYLNDAPSGVLTLPAYERVSGYLPDIWQITNDDDRMRTTKSLSMLVRYSAACRIASMEK
jgi:hypothetical protein